MHHNEIRDITAEWLECVCHNVVIQPPFNLLDDFYFVMIILILMIYLLNWSDMIQ